MGEEFDLKGKKKIIKVRRLSLDEDGAATSHNENISSPMYTLRENSSGSLSSNEEEEIQIIELGKESNHSDHPIKIMFPSLRQEGIDSDTLLQSLSTSDIAKLLKGHKAYFTKTRNLNTRRLATDFTAIIETPDDEYSLSDSNKTNSETKTYERPRLDSADADDSDNEYSPIDENPSFKHKE